MHLRLFVLLLVVLGLFWPSAAGAHLFWLVPDKDRVAPGETVKVEVGFGHQFPGERDLKPGQLHWLKVLDPQGREVPVTQHSHWQYEFTPATPGCYRVLAELKPGFVSRTPEGMRLGTKKEVPGAISAFHFVFQAQALIQAGENQTAAQEVAPSGLVLRPKQLPVGLAAGTAVPVQVWFNGQPLAGAKIELVGEGEKDPHQPAFAPPTTNAQGEVAVTIPAPGCWLVVAGYKQPYPDPAVADEIFYRQFLFLRAK